MPLEHELPVQHVRTQQAKPFLLTRPHLPLQCRSARVRRFMYVLPAAVPQRAGALTPKHHTLFKQLNKAPVATGKEEKA
jgi:hypothetical protein